jgi:hypothetical protein
MAEWVLGNVEWGRMTRMGQGWVKIGQKKERKEKDWGSRMGLSNVSAILEGSLLYV